MMARPHARGFVLVVALGLLLALTIGSLVAARTTTLELRMARYAADAVLAFHAAEAALVDAERWLVQNGGNAVDTFTAAREPGAWRGVRTTAGGHRGGAPRSGRRAAFPNPSVPGVEQQPRYIVEWLTTLTDTGSEDDPLHPVMMEVFGVTARGTGTTADVTVTLQSTFGRAVDGSRARRLSWTELP